jgi:hypothetical protein
MSRLTKKNGKPCIHCNALDCFADCKELFALYNKLAHYEDLEEQGRLIELPCKVGDKLYDISDIVAGCDNEIFVNDANWITLTKDENGKLTFDMNGFEYRPEDFGNVVFLTEEKAYAKLSEISQAMMDELEAEAEVVAMEGGAE